MSMTLTELEPSAIDGLVSTRADCAEEGVLDAPWHAAKKIAPIERA